MLKKSNDKKLNQNENVKSKKDTATTMTTTKKATKKNAKIVAENATKKIDIDKKTKSTQSKKTNNSTKTKKTSASKSTNTKSTTSKTTKRVAKKQVSKLEYYDLPYSYNKTIVKVLAQTPFCLFVYWDISESDKKNLLNMYGDNFFNISKPYLQVTNETMNYTFEVKINDYANSWYINIKDSDSKYKVSLIRKFIENSNGNAKNVQGNSAPIYISTSNEMQSPNDHILFDRLGKTVFFKNVKTNIVESKNVTTFSLLNNVGQIYNIYELYQKIYSNELNEDKMELNLSSSSSSTFR